MALNLTGAAQKIFVHFCDPKSGDKLYDTSPEGKPDFKKPVGVWVYTPGSKEYRAAEAEINTEQLRRGKSALTGEQLQKNAARLLARTTVEFCNFEYNGDGFTPNVAEAFYSDPTMAAYVEQVQREQGDLGNAYKNTTFS